MSESGSDAAVPAVQHHKNRRPYEAPRVVWREPYLPVASGVSCIQLPGNPQCASGPTST